MRIAIVEASPEEECDAGERSRAFARVLEAAGHVVDTIAFDRDLYDRARRRRRSLMSRVRRRLLRRPSLPHVWDLVADELLRRLHRRGYACAIARGQPGAGVLSRFERLRILDLEGVEWLTALNSWGADRRVVDDTYQRERALIESAHAVLVRHEAQRSLLMDCFGKTACTRLIVVPSGCDTVAADRAGDVPPKILFVGSSAYRSDPYLLALLTARSPVAIDCYGPEPARPLSFLPRTLAYRGDTGRVMPSQYTLGLVTAARDQLGEVEPSGRFAYHFAHGLPVLFPRWVKAGHEFADCALPYDEIDFPDVVRSALAPDRLAAMRSAARARASRMRWDQTLAPVVQLIQETR